MQLKGEFFMVRVISMIFLLALCTEVIQAETVEIADSDASKHIGDVVTVRGIVGNVYTSRAGNTFVNFGRPYPNQTFTAVIFRKNALLFPNVHSLEGSEVFVTGEVRLYKGKPEIILETSSQLRTSSSKR
jgi:DNA/RNA endonuclease YhcR with UshA esterase domain